MDARLPENRSDLINHLQRLWQHSPGDYWPAFRASGLSAQDVWPDAVQGEVRAIARTETMTPPSKRKGAKAKDEGARDV